MMFLRRSGIVVFVLCGTLVAGTMALGAPSPSVDIVPGHYLNGLDFLTMSDLQQAYYVAGVYDAFRAVEAESAYHLISQLMEGTYVRRNDNDKSSADITLSRLGRTLAGSPRTYMQVLAITKEYIASNPYDLDAPAALLIWRAIAEADWD